jgi:hypothetical protein
MPSSRKLRRVALVRTDVSEEHIASIIRVTRISDLGTTLVITSNRSTLRRNTRDCYRCFYFAETSVVTRTDGVTFKNTAFFIVTAVKTSDLI